jgi:HSP20 family protein
MTLAKLNRLFSDRGWHEPWETEGAIAATDWAPSVDILETDSEIVIKTELPGVDVKAISVGVDNNVLTIRGERHLEKDLKKESYHRIECFYGKFSRSFSLPSFVDHDNVRGEYKDGVLTLTLPKKAASRSRSVAVTAA